MTARGEERPGAAKPGSQEWQRCRSCGSWWPVHEDFGRHAVPVVCPACHEEQPYQPGPVDDR